MRGKQRSRIKSLTRDTNLALEHTCNGLADHSDSLIQSSQHYVLLGELFTTDYLEATFVELRQCSGGTYSITVQNALEKLRIRKTWLLLKFNVGAVFDEAAGQKCSYSLEENIHEVLENLPNSERSVHGHIHYVLGVYLCRTLNEEDEESTFYYETSELI